MLARLSQIRWKTILLAGIAPHAVQIVFTILAIFAYSMVLAFMDSGASYQERIDQFTRQLNSLALPVWLVAATFFAAAWAAYPEQDERAILYGLLAGAIAALIGPAFGLLGPPAPLLALFVTAAGWLGGAMVAWRS